MTDQNQAIPAGGDDTRPSQVIEPRDTHETPRPTNQFDQITGAEPAKEQAKPATNREALERALDDADKVSKAAEAKPTKEPVAEPDKTAKTRAEDGKFAKVAPDGEKPAQEATEADKGAPEKAATGQEPADRGRPSEGQNRYGEAPARFLPAAKEVWAHVPKAIKADLHRIEQEHEAEKAQLRTASERYDRLRDFDELAHSNGRDLRESLIKVNQVEQAMARDPVAGLDAVLREIGPRKADGSYLTLFEVAQHIVSNGPEAYQSGVQHSQRQLAEQASTQQIQSLQQQLESMRGDMATKQTVDAVIAPFASQNPRFTELQGDIMLFLQSGKIPASLSPEEKLAVAYDMAARINPRSMPSAADPEEPAAAGRMPVDDAGMKSIRGAPSSGQTGTPKRIFKSNREALEAAMAEAGIR